MQTIWAERALLPDGWAQQVSVDIDNQGRIASVEAGAPQNNTDRYAILLASPVNVHSHAFQRAMAGLTEARGANAHDSFWTWRDLMYRFLEHLTPEYVQAITAFVQMEMLEAGYSTHVEFHYLHHQQSGAAYDNLSELSERIIAAADHTGIGLCLLPVHYQYGGCDARALNKGQVRFGNDLDQFQRLRDGAGLALKSLHDDARLGVAAHSLRAVAQVDLTQYPEHFTEGPIHLHLAEQRAEIDEVLSHLGKRPVEWMLDNVRVDERWCMVHCTQMTPHETTRLAQTGAVAGLCPITEFNLGDGIFDGVRWMNYGGDIAIGSDCNIRIALSEELRSLEYSQRLRDHSRAALADDNRSSGRFIYDAILKGGTKAAQRRSGLIAEGCWADLLALDGTHISLQGRREDQILDSWIFAGDDRWVSDVWSAGRHQVKNGQHIKRTEITNNYRKTIRELTQYL